MSDTSAPKARVVISAGGTGGHIVPAQIMAKYFQQHGYAVSCIGTTGALEKRLLSDFELHTLHVTGLRGKSKLDSFKGVWHMFIALLRSIKILLKLRPEVVLCMGGYVTVPVAIAAKLLGIPVVVHEQNAISGLSNRYLARIAVKVLSAFPDAFPNAITAEMVGNPLRDAILQLPNRTAANSELHVLVLGGSQGAQKVNDFCMQAFANLKNITNYQILHQTGKADFDRVTSFYAEHAVDVKCSAFIDNMADAYAWADVVVSRSGALSVSEIGAAALPALFIPYPYAVDDHQYENAKFLVSANAAYVWREDEVTAMELVKYLQQWQQNPRLLLEMGQRGHAVTILDAAEKIYSACIKINLG